MIGLSVRGGRQLLLPSSTTHAIHLYHPQRKVVAVGRVSNSPKCELEVGVLVVKSVV